MDLMMKVFRSAILALAGNRFAENLALRYGLNLGAKKFVAGTTLEDAIKVIKQLNAKGISTTLDHLGEGVRHEDEATIYKEEYLRLVGMINQENLNSNVSLKPTQMGLGLNPKLAYDHIRTIVSKAHEFQHFVRLDMEDTPYTDATIDIVLKLHEDGLTNVGTVIQAYLHRTEEDVHRLTERKINLRLVKGAYKESERVAFAKMADVNENFKRIIQIRLDSGVYTGIATHDDKIISWVKEYSRQHHIDRGSYEFQMLYGVRMQLQEDLILEGYKVRCYLPYGEMWYPYFVRRLAERPANLMFVVKNIFKR